MLPRNDDSDGNPAPRPDRRLRRLERRLALPLPGLSAQQRMAPKGRISRHYDPCPPGALHAAVLLLVVGATSLVFIRRANDGRAHSGQIAFPGGAREPQDQDLAETALRETEEEIGVRPTDIGILGALTPLYIPVSNFTVHPFVGSTASRPAFACQPGEVDAALVLPIAAFNSSLDRLEVARSTGITRVPSYRFGDIHIWGATAMMMAELLEVWDVTDPSP